MSRAASALGAAFQGAAGQARAGAGLGEGLGPELGAVSVNSSPKGTNQGTEKLSLYALSLIRLNLEGCSGLPRSPELQTCRRMRFMCVQQG